MSTKSLGRLTRRSFLAGLPGMPLALMDRQQALKVPGLSLAVYSKGMVLTHAVGRLSVAHADPVTATSAFQAASISKTVAGLTVLALARAGSLRLDDDARAMTNRWTPPGPEPPAGSLTLRRLLGMTAGTNVPGFAGYPAGAALPSLKETLAGMPPANNAPVTVMGMPGTVRAYSGGGYQILEAALEDHLETSFTELVARLVLQPLGMSRSRFATPKQHGATGPALAHDRRGEPVAGGFHLYPEHAAAGLWSTPSDLLLMAAAFCRAAAGDPAAALARQDHAQLATSVDGLGYGLGVALGAAEGSTFIFKRGNNLGYKSGLIAFPAAAEAAVVMTNGDNGEALVDEVLFALRDRQGWPRFERLPE
jgi:CubicO group peptidase (beta-lactamase class C family)